MQATPAKTGQGLTPLDIFRLYSGELDWACNSPDPPEQPAIDTFGTGTAGTSSDLPAPHNTVKKQMGRRTKGNVRRPSARIDFAKYRSTNGLYTCPTCGAQMTKSFLRIHYALYHPEGIPLSVAKESREYPAVGTSGFTAVRTPGFTAVPNSEPLSYKTSSLCGASKKELDGMELKHEREVDGDIAEFKHEVTRASDPRRADKLAWRDSRQKQFIIRCKRCCYTTNRPFNYRRHMRLAHHTCTRPQSRQPIRMFSLSSCIRHQHQHDSVFREFW